MSGVPGSGPPFSYTPESANALLPELQDRLVALREAYAVTTRHEQAVRANTGGNGGSHHAQEWSDAEHVVAASLAWLRARGIILRDPDQGLIDFPSRRDGRRILLCWRLGEPAVAWWHELSAGFSGRRPL